MPVNVNPIMAAIVEAADTLNTAPDDYINPEDGLKYCGKCHTPKEAYFPEQYRKNGLDKHPIACKCAAEERARREAEQRELERLNRTAMLRSEAFRDIPAAVIRVKRRSAPANVARLRCDTPCAKTGSCAGIQREGMTDGCGVDGRICCNYLVSARQRVPCRIKVILVGEELGY